MNSHGGRPQVTFVETAKPAVEPVSAATVKLHRRIDADDTSQDAVIAILIAAARRYAEEYTGKSFIQRTFRATMDRFPGGACRPAEPFAAYPNWLQPADGSTEIHLERGPLVSVQAINYLDVNGDEQVLDKSVYVIDATGLRPRIAPAAGQRWPDTLRQIAAVTIDFTAGFGPDATNVPESYSNWILVRVGTLFENREETTVVARGRIEAVPFLDSLLEFNRVPVI